MYRGTTPAILNTYAVSRKHRARVNCSMGRGWSGRRSRNKRRYPKQSSRQKQKQKRKSSRQRSKQERQQPCSTSPSARERAPNTDTDVSSGTHHQDSLQGNSELFYTCKSIEVGCTSLQFRIVPVLEWLALK